MRDTSEGLLANQADGSIVGGTYTIFCWRSIFIPWLSCTCQCVLPYQFPAVVKFICNTTCHPMVTIFVTCVVSVLLGVFRVTCNA